MLQFIYIPLVIGIITLGIYKLFELFVRKKERLTIIDKIGDKLHPSMIDDSISFRPSFEKPHNISFISLRIACLLLGIGLGLLVGFFISQYYNTADGQSYINTHFFRETVYGASVLLFGGLSLLLAFIIEMRLNKSNLYSKPKDTD